eukprot:5912936-Amphidinium_carterae.1
MQYFILGYVLLQVHCPYAAGEPFAAKVQGTQTFAKTFPFFALEIGKTLRSEERQSNMEKASNSNVPAVAILNSIEN